MVELPRQDFHADDAISLFENLAFFGVVGRNLSASSGSPDSAKRMPVTPRERAPWAGFLPH